MWLYRDLFLQDSARQPIAVGVFTPDTPPDHLRGEAVGHNDKNLAKMARWTLNRLDGMPGVIALGEEKAAITQHLRGATSRKSA